MRKSTVFGTKIIKIVENLGLEVQENFPKLEKKMMLDLLLRFLRFREVFGVENRGKITKNLSGMRSGNENGDFSEIVLACTREHDF